VGIGPRKESPAHAPEPIAGIGHILPRPSLAQGKLRGFPTISWKCDSVCDLLFIGMDKMKTSSGTFKSKVDEIAAAASNALTV
jgi:hypothetical protein